MTGCLWVRQTKYSRGLQLLDETDRRAPGVQNESKSKIYRTGQSSCHSRMRSSRSSMTSDSTSERARRQRHRQLQSISTETCAGAFQGEVGLPRCDRQAQLCREVHEGGYCIFHSPMCSIICRPESRGEADWQVPTSDEGQLN
jgi:hypothetical protein